MDLNDIQKSVELHMNDTRAHMMARAKEVDSNMKALDNKLDSLVNWAISTRQGDVGWLQKRGK
tara:strand:- start:6350 stop:6538 length:189 start_codon:yes stop_codon:yes gene_type:complete